MDEKSLKNILSNTEKMLNRLKVNEKEEDPIYKHLENMTVLIHLVKQLTEFIVKSDEDIENLKKENKEMKEKVDKLCRGKITSGETGPI